MFEDWRMGRDWLPDTIYQNRYQQASYVSLSFLRRRRGPHHALRRAAASPARIFLSGEKHPSHGEAETAATTACFWGGIAPIKRPLPSYTITLPDEATSKWQTRPRIRRLSFPSPRWTRTHRCRARKKTTRRTDDSKKKKDRESPDFTVELVAADGTVATAMVSRFAAVPPPLTEKFTKLDLLESEGYEKDTEPVFQTVRIPLTAFKSDGLEALRSCQSAYRPAEVRPHADERDLPVRPRLRPAIELSPPSDVRGRTPLEMGTDPIKRLIIKEIAIPVPPSRNKTCLLPTFRFSSSSKGRKEGIWCGRSGCRSASQLACQTIQPTPSLWTSASAGTCAHSNVCIASTRRA